MSQVKAIEILDIPVDQIRTSPYQPRLYFDIESLATSIEQDGMVSTPVVRRKSDSRTEYELVDGERRLRAVKKLGWETIPVQVVDIDDETARRIVFTLNEEREPYNAEEYTKFFRNMYDQMRSYRAVADAFGKSPNTIINYVNISILPESLQKAVWAGKISIGSIQEMDQIFAEAKDEAGGVFNVEHYSNSQAYQYICSVLEELLLAESKKPRVAVREQYIDPYLERLEGERVRRAKEEAEKIIPKEVEVEVDLESPNGLRQAAKVLLEEAEKLKSPEEVLEELHEKARDALSKGRGNAKSKIENVAELGFDTSEFEKRYREIEAQIEDDPEAAYEASKELKKEIDKEINKNKSEQAKKEREERERRIREEAAAKARAEAQAKAAEEIQKIKETAKEEVKEELRKDEAFKAELRTELMKDIVSPSRIVTLPVEIPEEEARVLRERIEKQRQKMTEWMLDPEIQKRGKLFKNWVAHGTVLDVIGSMFCPKHDNETWKDLKWSCGLSVEEAYEILRKKLEKGGGES